MGYMLHRRQVLGSDVRLQKSKTKEWNKISDKICEDNSLNQCVLPAIMSQ